MDKLIYFGWIAPVINLLSFLIKKGIKVYYVGFEYNRKKLESIGVIFIPYMQINRIKNPYEKNLIF
ncbi:MAG: hypothetical protein ACRDCW_13515 [Sarcina sp.]